MTSLTYGQILKIAGPMLVANLSIPLLGLVDTAILGHLDDAIYLGAAALGAQIITTIFWSFGFLRMGTTGFTARALGKKNNDLLNEALQQPLLLALLLSSLILIIQWLSLPLITQFFGGENDLNDLVLSYIHIRIYSAPATLCTYVLVGWFIGVQKTHYAMYILVITNLVNIALDYLFIIKMDMNTEGAALASVISEYLGLIIALTLVLVELKATIGLKRHSRLFNPATYSDMLLSSKHLFIRTLCLLFVFLFFAGQAAQLGESTLASNAILLSILTLIAYFLDGFAYSAETLCGAAWGGKELDRFFDICKKTTLLAFIVALGSSLILLSGQNWIIQLYTDLPAVILSTQNDLLWLAILPLIAIWCYQLDGIFIGIGKTKAMRNNMLFATLFVYLPSWYFTRHLGNQGLWIAFVIFFAARALSMSASFFTVYREITLKSVK